MSLLEVFKLGQAAGRELLVEVGPYGLGQTKVVKNFVTGVAARGEALFDQCESGIRFAAERSYGASLSIGRGTNEPENRKQ